eukprot:Opistho-1_new@102262
MQGEDSGTPLKSAESPARRSPRRKMASTVHEALLPKDLSAGMRAASPVANVERVRRNLFGCVEEDELLAMIKEDTERHLRDKKGKYNFDFEADAPVESDGARYEWTLVQEQERIERQDTDAIVPRAPLRRRHVPKRLQQTPRGV